MHKVPLGHLQRIRRKVILHCRVSLYNVAPLASHVQVMDETTCFFELFGHWSHSKAMGSVRYMMTCKQKKQLLKENVFFRMIGNWAFSKK